MNYSMFYLYFSRILKLIINARNLGVTVVHAMAIQSGAETLCLLFCRSLVFLLLHHLLFCCLLLILLLQFLRILLPKRSTFGYVAGDASVTVNVTLYPTGHTILLRR